MDEPARFERPLADLSARFSGVPYEPVDAEIDRARGGADAAVRVRTCRA